MSGVSESSDPKQSGVRNPVINPASNRTIQWMGILLLGFTVILFYLLITTWPVLLEVKEGEKVISSSFKAFNIFGMPCSWAPDRQMMFTVVMAGALGSLTQMLTSFGDYVGNRELSANWIWFLILRIPIGIALALLFYFIIRGGLLIPTIQVQPHSTANSLETTLQINAYSIAAFSALAGMFSKQATDKLAAVFDTVFAMKKPVEREGTLGSSQSIKISPATLTTGKREDLTVTGSGFQKDTKATINGKDRTFNFVSDTQGTVTTMPEDVAKAGRLELVVTNPNKDTFTATVDVVEPSAPNQPVVAPTISDTDPKELSKDGPKALTVIGQGFQNGCTATINGDTRAVVFGGDSRITVTLTDQDLAQPGTLKLAVRNPGADGQASDVHDIAVK
jgi:IPT/TIG domain